MSEEFEEPGRGAWVDPRFRRMVAGLALNRVERRPGKRPRRVCPHGAGVTVMVDPETRRHRNIECGECFPFED